MAGRAAAFLDRDGTIIEAVRYINDPNRVRLVPGAAAALRRLAARGYLLVVVSNQSGVARGLITAEQLCAVDNKMTRLLRDEGVNLEAAYYCRHRPAAGCCCRKPRPGMIYHAAEEHRIDVRTSVMIGDKPRDVLAGHRAGCGLALMLSSASKQGWASAIHRIERWRD